MLIICFKNTFQDHNVHGAQTDKILLTHTNKDWQCSIATIQHTIANRLVK